MKKIRKIEVIIDDAESKKESYSGRMHATGTIIFDGRKNRFEIYGDIPNGEGLDFLDWEPNLSDIKWKKVEKFITKSVMNYMNKGKKGGILLLK